jgi:hypothetical protein
VLVDDEPFSFVTHIDEGVSCRDGGEIGHGLPNTRKTHPHIAIVVTTSAFSLARRTHMRFASSHPIARRVGRIVREFVDARIHARSVRERARLHRQNGHGQIFLGAQFVDWGETEN